MKEGLWLSEHTCTNCGADFSDDQFCPQCGQWVDPLADGEVEHFDLDDSPPDDYESDPGVATIPYTSITCPSCGAANPESNRHCEECGARLSQGPLPIAPQPLLQASAGVRAAIMITGVLLGVLLIAWVFGKLTGDSTEGATSTNPSSTITAPSVVVNTQKLPVIFAECSTEFAPFVCTNLTDGSVETYWNDNSLKGIDAEITIRFATPVQLEQIVLMNVTDDEKFKRNFRVKDLEITADDVASPFTFTFDDNNSSQAKRIQTLTTQELTIRVTGTYASEPFTNPETGVVGIPFEELALAELEFYGKPGS